MLKRTILTFFLACWALSLKAGPIDIVRLKYGGGGDWYNDPEEETNLLREFSVRTGTSVNAEKFSFSAADDDLFLHPFLFITGHGEIKFTSREVERLRLFLASGGFLYADDDYGMDQSFRREMKRVFPEAELQELPSDFPLFNCYYDFSAGLPKIHEHEKGRPQAYGLFYQGRLAVFYTFNTNISDGWTSNHNDPAEKREEAVKMGVNILWYSLTRP
jgi:hypothetical protein